MHVQQHTLTRQSVLYSEKIAEDVFILGFQKNFDFEPGQVVGISVEENGPRRLYSICSGKEEDHIAILYNVVDEGYLTPRLSSLFAGDSIWVTEPRGDFLYDPGPSFWIASGTGIAPFYSMLKSGNFDRKILLHGERHLEKFYFYDEFYDTLGHNYIRCCSGEEDPAVFHGRVTGYLRSLPSLPLHYKYYLCGRAEMVVETRDILIERDIPFNHIISEIYF
ncbi:MAG: hypothetical protein K9J30_03545 [Bacteroidales bacterium]|nr:hypothetical protein [Bacteroidales bacterium]